MSEGLAYKPDERAERVYIGGLGGDGGRPSMERTQTGTPAEPDETAEAIYRAVRRGRRLLLPSRDARLARLLSRFLPGIYERVMARRIVPGRK